MKLKETDLSTLVGNREPAFVGIGRTEFTLASGRTPLALAAEAVRNALGDAGLTPSDVDGIATFGINDTASTIQVANALGIDVLGGVGANQSTSTAARAMPVDSTSGLPMPVAGTHTVTVANAGNAARLGHCPALTRYDVLSRAEALKRHVIRVIFPLECRLDLELPYPRPIPSERVSSASRSFSPGAGSSGSHFRSTANECVRRLGSKARRCGAERARPQRALGTASTA